MRKPCRHLVFESNFPCMPRAKWEFGWNFRRGGCFDRRYCAQEGGALGDMSESNAKWGKGEGDVGRCSLCAVGSENVIQFLLGGSGGKMRFGLRGCEREGCMRNLKFLLVCIVSMRSTHKKSIEKQNTLANLYSARAKGSCMYSVCRGV